MMDHMKLGMNLLATCARHGMGNDPRNAAVVAARALTVALAVKIRQVDDPGRLLALIVRDLSEAALPLDEPRDLRELAGIIAASRPRRKPRPRNVVDLASARRRRPSSIDKEPA